MRSVSPGFLAALRTSTTMVARAYVRAAGATTWTEVGLVGHSITADRGAVCRYSGQVQLHPDTDRDLIQPYGALLRIREGLVIPGGGEELVDRGTMRIDDVDEEADGTLTVQCYGREKSIEEARFTEPHLVEGNSAVQEISSLLSVAVPITEVAVFTDQDAVVPRSIYERERWKAIDGDDASLARAIGCEVYCDASGTFVIADVPTIDDPPVWTVDAGENGVLVGWSRRTSREGVYNVVVAYADRTSGDDAPLPRAVAQDNNPRSATYVGGPFLPVPRFAPSPLYLTNQQADLGARSILANSLGLTRSLSFQTVPNPALEPGDVVEVRLDDGTIERHLIDRIDPAGNAQTRSSEAVAR